MKKHTPPTEGLLAKLLPVFELSDNRRPLGFLIVAALSIGTPVLIGVSIERFSSSILAAMGGMVILYMRQTDLPNRLTTLASCSFGFLFGALTSFNPFLSSFSLAVTVFVVTVVCRFYRLPPPGTFLFILVACLSRTLPFELELLAEQVGTVLLGCMVGTLLGLMYTVFQAKNRSQLLEKNSPHQFDKVGLMIEASVIALFVAGGYLLALSIGLDNPYWVPISTAAIMQGATFRALWHRNLHQVFGTVLGMGLTWIIFSMTPSPWMFAVLIMLLSLIIEILITRNYGLAVIFITPLTVIFADANIAVGNTHDVMMARLVDILLGSFIGYLGGALMHQKAWFRAVESKIHGHKI